jgi:hypothetical protein
MNHTAGDFRTPVSIRSLLMTLSYLILYILHLKYASKLAEKDRKSCSAKDLSTFNVSFYIQFDKLCIYTNYVSLHRDLDYVDTGQDIKSVPLQATRELTCVSRMSTRSLP